MRTSIAMAAAGWSIALMFGGAAAASAQVVDSKFELFVTDIAESIRFYEVGFTGRWA